VASHDPSPCGNTQSTSESQTEYRLELCEYR